MSKINLNTSGTATNTTNKQVLNGIKIKTAKVHVGNSKHEDFIPEESVNITVGVFFDGTLNNRKNTNARLEYEKKGAGLAHDEELAGVYNKWYTFKKTGSYDNTYSNVARMEESYKKFKNEKEIQLSIYVEGIGTEDNESDYTFGKGLGTGQTGVRKKVKKGCENIVVDGIMQSKLGNKKINRLQIDVFGFSRGAAAARNFVYEVNKRKGQFKKKTGRARKTVNYNVDYGALGEALDKNAIEIKSLVVRFAGLYDTVASLGFSWEHKNNTKMLHLEAVKKALHTLQLAAADEHRANFILTDIRQTGGRGKEFFLPGVHSDIGGGYKDNIDEEVTLREYSEGGEKHDREKEYLIQEGWFNEDEIYISLWDGDLIGNRKGLSNKYSHIPLHLMIEYGIEKKVLFSLGKLKRSYPIEDEILIKTKKRLDAYLKGIAPQMDYTIASDKAILKKLRNKYFHFSSHFDDKIAWLIAPHKPNRENGERKRVINPG
ncbi:DUF2235 domain-containing protein [uncultured Zobellia sp.]|uniref:T6SS phospholipase effector Tle1-like catalytic domain-containing protein n=1 Tax=uncultured Zobellia sp. TaxID=255433 RepID=UPI0025933586|nr:DUF2235 domain-containing protein [uncultured Zobellia sp.]